MQVFNISWSENFPIIHRKAEKPLLGSVFLIKMQAYSYMASASKSFTISKNENISWNVAVFRSDAAKSCTESFTLFLMPLTYVCVSGGKNVSVSEKFWVCSEWMIPKRYIYVYERSTNFKPRLPFSSPWQDWKTSDIFKGYKKGHWPEMV